MTERYLFFNSTANDRRVHQASDMADYWQSFLSNGVITFDNNNEMLAVTVSPDDSSVNISTGRALVKGHLYVNDSNLNKMVSTSPVEDRIDRVVLRFDNTLPNRFIRVFIREGTRTSPPTLVRNDSIYELSLARIIVRAGQTLISQSDVIDERADESVCGFASSLVKVPTDIFSEQFRQFRNEYERWFAEIQSSSYATVEDVREVDNQIKREVANLNLQIEASQRVPEGKTFGTNFRDAFGLNIDTARTFSDNALPSGSTSVVVDDAEGFTVNKEVTVYDDENQERLKITNINGNTLTFERPLANSYKEGVNIARTMAVLSPSENRLNFGNFGSYALQEKNFGTYNFVAPLVNMNQLTQQSASQLPRLHRIKDRWIAYSVISSVGYIAACTDENPNTWTPLATIPTVTGNVTSMTLTVNDNHIIALVRVSAAPYIRIYSYDHLGNLIDTFVPSENADFVNNGGLITSAVGRLDLTYVKEINALILTTDGSNATSASVSRLTIDRSGIITYVNTLVQNSANAPNPSATSYGARPYSTSFCVIPDGSILYASVINNTNDTTSKIVIQKITSNFSALTTVLSYASSNFSVNQNSNSVLRNIKIIYNNVYNRLEIFYAASNVMFGYSTDGGSTWTLTTIAGANGGQLSINEQSDGTILLLTANGASTPNLFSKKIDSENFISSTVTNTGNQFLIGCRNVLGEQEIPFTIMTSSPFFIGKGSVGYGSEILSNDVRFTFDPTKEAAMWLEHNSQVNVSEARFGQFDMDKSTIPGETQFTAVSSVEDIGEIRFTMTKSNASQNGYVTKLLGGIL